MNRHTRTRYSLRSIRRNAQDALFSGSNWIASLIMLFSVMLLLWGSVSLADSFLAITARLCIDHLSVSVLWIIRGVLYLLLSPLLPGLLSYFSDLYRFAHGEGFGRVAPSMVFHCYASVSSIVRAWIQTAELLLLLLLPLFAGFLSRIGNDVLARLMVRMLPEYGAYTADVFYWSGFIILLLSACYINGRCAPALFLSIMYPHLPLTACMLHSIRATKHTVRDAVLLQLQLLLLCAVSVLTAGILFFLYVLPLTIFLYISYSTYTVYQSESY